MARAVIVSAVRTPFGKLGGGLAGYEATELGSLVIKAALERVGIEPDEPEYVIMGQVLQAGAGQAPARQAAIGAGLPKETPADTINKVCASSIRAVQIADTMIRAGDHEVIVTGGMESMSNAPYLLKKARFGYRLGHGELIDSHDLRRAHRRLRLAAHGAAQLDGLPRARDQPRGAGRVGVPLAAARRGGTGGGRYEDEIVPVGGVIADESIRRDTTLESLAKLKPVFDPEGTTTAGNAPGVNDGASCVIVTSEEFAERRGLEILGTIVSQGYVADDFAYLVRTPANAAAIAFEKAGKTHRRRQAGRDQRGVLVGRAQLGAAARRRRGDRERERRRRRARASDRRLGRADRRHDGARAPSQRRRPRPRRDLLRRRPGRRAPDRGLRRPAWP